MAGRSLQALSHNYATKYPLVIMGCTISTPKIAPSHGATANPNYLPHPWTKPTHPNGTSSSNQPFFHNAPDRLTDNNTIILLMHLQLEAE